MGKVSEACLDSSRDSSSTRMFALRIMDNGRLIMQSEFCSCPAHYARSGGAISAGRQRRQMIFYHFNCDLEHTSVKTLIHLFFYDEP